MRTIEYLTDPALGPLYYPGLVTAVLVALLCAPLSVLVVLKRLAFVGQGVSHAVSTDRGSTWHERKRIYPKGCSSHMAVGPAGIRQSVRMS